MHWQSQWHLTTASSIQGETMFGIGIAELFVFSLIFVAMIAAGWASALLIIRTLQQR